MGTIHIALAADSNYIMPTTVVLQSIFDNNQGEAISFYLLFLEGTLKEEDLSFFVNLARTRGGQLTGLEIKKEQIEGFPETRHGKATLLRLCLPQMLPQLNKILYLDGDIVVHGRLSPLYDTDISSYYVAASKDSASAYDINYQTSMDIEQSHFYFNAGILLINLSALRKIDLAKEMNQFAQKHYERISAPDQDFFNYICQQKTLYIHPRYNMNYMLEKDIVAKIWTKEEVREAKRSPVIVHYIGPVKPWSILCIHPQRKLWWKYLKKTGFAGFQPKDTTAKNRIRKYYLLFSKSIERQFSLEMKRKIGKLIPAGFKKSLKKSLQKSI